MGEKMDSADAIILEAVDSALSSFNDIDKDELYNMLESEYDVKREEICQNLGLFHTVLK